MTLYHGSDTVITRPDLSKSRPCKDFGRGFYLTADRHQAERMAMQTARRTGGSPVVNSYDFDESRLTDGSLRVRVFRGYTEQWARFILANRDRLNPAPPHGYDIVVGPIADDRVGVQLFRYMKHYIDLKTLVEELRYKELTIQYYFGTQRATDSLTAL